MLSPVRLEPKSHVLAHVQFSKLACFDICHSKHVLFYKYSPLGTLYVSVSGGFFVKIKSQHAQYSRIFYNVCEPAFLSEISTCKHR